MKVHYNLSLTTNPNLRTEALISLSGGPKSLDDLRNDLNVSSTTASHSLRDLEEDKLIYEDAERNYVLTAIGTIITNGLVNCSDTIETLHEFERFWLEHDLSAIPDYLLERIGWLKDSRVISGTPIDVFKAFSTIITLLKDATEMKVVTSILIPDIKSLFDMFVTKKDLQIIVTEEVLHPSIEEIGREHFREALEKNVTLYQLRQDLKIGLFTVTDHFMALVPYRLEGVFDWSSDLISCNKTAIDWGLALFNHYAGVSDSVDLS